MFRMWTWTINISQIIGTVLVMAISLLSQNSFSASGAFTGLIFDPQLSPNQCFLSFERQRGDLRELVLYNRGRGETMTIQPSQYSGLENLTTDLFDLSAGLGDQKMGGSFQLDWRPIIDRWGRQWFTFISSGQNNNYDVYVSYIDDRGELGPYINLTQSANVDLYPRWSPDGKQIVYVSNGTGKGDLYLILDLDRLISGEAFTPQYLRLTTNPYEDTQPAWSPDGRFIAYTAMEEDGGKRNYGIDVIPVSAVVSVQPAQPLRITRNADRAETNPSWANGDLSYIAYYSFVPGSETGLVNIGLVQLYMGQDNRTIAGGTLIQDTPTPFLAEGVLVNENRGPVWLPETERQTIIYTRRDEAHFNPVYLVSVTNWINKRLPFEFPLSFISTKMNQEVNVYPVPRGLLFLYASQYQEKGYKLTSYLQPVKRPNWEPTFLQEKKPTIAYESFIPGLPYIRKGDYAAGIYLAGWAASFTYLTATNKIPVGAGIMEMGMAMLISVLDAIQSKGELIKWPVQCRQPLPLAQQTFLHQQDNYAKINQFSLQIHLPW